MERSLKGNASTNRTQTTGHSPRIDAFGTVRLPDTDFKTRVIEFAADRLALFQDADPANPVVLDLTSPIQIKGRMMKTTFTSAETGEEVELLFQKAGCGCETPRSLKGGRNALIRGAGLS